MAVGWKSLAGIVGAASIASVGTLYGVLVREPATAPAPAGQPENARQQGATPAPVTPMAPKVETATSQAGKSPTGKPQTGKAQTDIPEVGKPDAGKLPQVATSDSTSPVPAANPTPQTDKPAEVSAKNPAVPTFDVVRITPQGDAVIAGQGTPGATVELLRNGDPYARAVADVGGQWAIVPPPLPKGTAELSLRVTTPDGRVSTSQQAVSVRVPDGPGEEVVIVLNTPNQPSRVLTDATKPASHAPVVTTSVVAPQETPGAPAKLTERANTAIRTVEADEAGRFFVTGTAEPGATIRIYLNDTAVATVTAAKDGAFGLTIEKGMLPGQYHVRADDVSPVNGQVLTRAEVPFSMSDKTAAATVPAVVTAANTTPKITLPQDAKPASPQTGNQAQSDGDPSPASNTSSGANTVASGGPQSDSGNAATAAPGSSNATVSTPGGVTSRTTPAASTVQPPSVAVIPEIRTTTIARGDNLWRISRKAYGEGIRYTWIYDANVKQISDPNLIFPGQIFVMPDKKAP